MVRAVAGDSQFRAFVGVAGVYTDNARTKARMGTAVIRSLNPGNLGSSRGTRTRKGE
jgi:hypothetical protein